MTSFGDKLLGGHEFSLVPPEGLHAIISLNPWLLLPTKYVLANSRKQNVSAIFEWQEKEQGWFLYAGEFPHGWEKKVKLVNLPASTWKGSAFRSAKPKFPKKGIDASKVYSNIVPYKGGLLSISNIVLKSTPPSTRAHSTRRSATTQPRPPMPRQSLDAPPSSKTHGSKRKTSPPAPSPTTKRRVCYI